MANGEYTGTNPQPQMAGAAPRGPGMSRNAWIAAGIIIFIALVAALAARTFFRGDTTTLTLPGDLTPGQIATLRALAARAEEMHINAGESPMLTEVQARTLEAFLYASSGISHSSELTPEQKVTLESLTR
ncbi:MAG: hypothetical protein HYY10_00220 [Candidatus Liptonbacteria bacterium]|nr:hypothetical protein [Candidatus Liptonbacteria bacterium]